MILDKAIDGHPMPNRPGDDDHRPTHPDKPSPPPKPDHPSKPEKPITVIVNGTEKVLPEGTRVLTYEDVVKLAYGTYNSSESVIYTVVFSNGPVENKKGTLVKGDTARVKEGMVFNVGRSDKS